MNIFNSKCAYCMYMSYGNIQINTPSVRILVHV